MKLKTALMGATLFGCAKDEECQSRNTRYSNDPVPLAEGQTTRIDFSSGPGLKGCVGQNEALGNMAMRWEGTGTLTWDVDVPETASYEVSMSYASMRAGANVSVKNAGNTVHTELAKSDGPFEHYLTPSDLEGVDLSQEFLVSYDRLEFDSPLELEAGTQTISLKLGGMKDLEFVDFRALELTPTEAVESIEEEWAEAVGLRADADWMVDAQYGVMFHWTDLTVNSDGSQLDYKAAVEQFDVEAFGALSEQVGAGYVIFTLNHQYPHCPAPIAAWEDIHPGWTTERDLIQEIADELNSRGIDLVLYVASHLVGNPDGVGESKWLRAHEFGSEETIPEATHFDIAANNKTVLTAIGERYGEQVRGFWLDGWDLIPETYPHTDYRELFEAAKTGHPERLVAFNRWVFPTVTPWQDYWAGEIDSPDKSPTEQFMQTEVGKSLQFHGLIAMEDDWLYSAEGLEDGAQFYKARYDAEEVIEYINEVNGARGAVTINLAIRQDLSMPTKALEIMETVKSTIR
jgi:hypothetical protein